MCLEPRERKIKEEKILIFLLFSCLVSDFSRMKEILKEKTIVTYVPFLSSFLIFSVCLNDYLLSFL